MKQGPRGSGSVVQGGSGQTQTQRAAVTWVGGYHTKQGTGLMRVSGCCHRAGARRGVDSYGGATARGSSVGQVGLGEEQGLHATEQGSSVCKGS